MNNARLTDGDFVLLPQHDVVWCEVAVDDSLLLVQIPQGQTHLREHLVQFSYLRTV